MDEQNKLGGRLRSRKTLSTFCRPLDTTCYYLYGMTQDIRISWCARADYTRVLCLGFNQFVVAPFFGFSTRQFNYLDTLFTLPRLNTKFITLYKLLQNVCRPIVDLCNYFKHTRINIGLGGEPMGRINFEDSIYKHEYYGDLLIEVGDKYKTNGMLLKAFELAQMYWLKFHGIPKDKWPEDLNPLIKWKFARTETRASEEYIYVLGSKEHCAFLEKQSEAGKKGGKSKSPKKLKNLKQNQKPEKTPKPHRSTAETTPKPTEVSYSYSFSDSNSFSNSDSGSTLGEASQKPAVLPKDSTKSVIALYCELWKQRYKATKSPPITGKTSGILKGLVSDFGEKRVRDLIEAYLQMPDSWFVTKSHDIATLVQNLNKVSHFIDTGKLITRREINQLDNQSTNQNTLDALREGKI